MRPLNGCWAITTAAVVAIMAGNGADLLHGATYMFKQVYSTPQQLFGAAINDNGLVALINENSTLITTDGLTSTIIAGPPGVMGVPRLEWLNSPASSQVLSLNNGGYVSFRGTAANGTMGVLAGNGATTKVIASYNFLYGSTQYAVSRVPTSINDNGMVAFEAWSYQGYFAFLGDGSAPVARLNDSQDRVSSNPAINSSGAIAYNFNDGAGRVGIQNGTQLLTFQDIGNVVSMPSLNENGAAAFYTRVGGVPKIAVGDGTSTPELTDLSAYPLVSSWDIGNGYIFDGAWLSSLALNNQGIVAFEAPIGMGQQYPDRFGIYVGPDPAADKVIACGDQIGDATVTWLDFRRGGLNDHGQIAFYASLSDGTGGVFIATPAPEPSAMLLLAIGMLGILGVMRLESKRGSS